MTTADILIVGGGLHGLSAALQAARRGARVVLCERDFVGRHASGATAAGVRTLGRDMRELPLSLEAAETWRNIESLVGDDCGYRSCGQLQVAEDEEALDGIRARIARLEARGYRHERLLDAAEVREILPAAATHCVGGAYVANDGAANPHRTIGAFRAAAESAGTVVRERSAVTAIRRQGGTWRVETATGGIEAPILLNAAGAWGARVGALAGEELVQEIRTSMMIVTERTERAVGPVVSSLGRTLSFKQTDEGTLLIGGGAQGRLRADRNSSAVDALALAEAARSAARLFPWTRSLQIVRSWAGMEAQIFDRIPAIGMSAVNEGLIHAFGFSGHGFQLVPAVGRALAQLACGEVPDHDLSDFTPARVTRSQEVAV